MHVKIFINFKHIFTKIYLYNIVSLCIMNRNLFYSSIMAIVFITTTLSMMITQIESFNSINAQVDPSQDPVQPIPPSNDTNTNQTTPIVFFSQ